VPASEIMKLYHEGRLHAGPHGTVVTKKAQAKAILLSYLRKEGHNIPEAPAK
jgi:hypothetical protein